MASNSTIGMAGLHCDECGRDNPVLPIPGTLLHCPCGSSWVIRLASQDLGVVMVGAQIDRSVERGETYYIADSLMLPDEHFAMHAPMRFIACLRTDCPALGRPSYSKDDIEHRYCGGCRRYHERTPHAVR